MAQIGDFTARRRSQRRGTNFASLPPRPPGPEPPMGTQHAGFVDIQVNGYLGISFSSDDLTVESCAEC